jgi:hypothetical protein
MHHRQALTVGPEETMGTRPWGLTVRDLAIPSAGPDGDAWSR